MKSAKVPICSVEREDLFFTQHNSFSLDQKDTNWSDQILLNITLHPLQTIRN